MRPVVVIDNGSGYMKAGFSTSNSPDINIPSLIGRPMLRFAEKVEDIQLKPIMIGDEVTPVRSLLELSHPIAEGIIENPEEMQLLWDYALNEKLGVQKSDYEDTTIMLTEAPANPNKNKILMGEILMEKMGIKAFNIEPQAKLTLVSEGLQSGMVLDSGDGVTHCIPIIDGYILHHWIGRLNIAGRHITNQLIRLLQVKGYAFNSSADFETVRELKEKYCFVSCDYEGDQKLDSETTYYNSKVTLPDGRKILLSSEKFQATEILFKPFLCQNDNLGMQDIVDKSINECPMDTRKSLYGNIVLSGCTTMFPGFASRFDQEMRALYVKSKLKNVKGEKNIKIDINVVDTPRRKISVFLGATVMSNICNTEETSNYWINKSEWQEQGGERCIYKKCQNVII